MKRLTCEDNILNTFNDHLTFRRYGNVDLYTNIKSNSNFANTTNCVNFIIFVVIIFIITFHATGLV